MVNIEVLSVRSPQWVDERHTSINCLIRTNTLAEEVPFTASSHDPEPHGREVFARCIAGDFGEIAPMEQPGVLRDVTTQPELLAQFKRLEILLGFTNLENARRSFRSVVILWGSFLDGLLDKLLEVDALRALSAGQAAGKPPRTFDSRIKMAHAAGIIDQEEADKCHHIRHIRNAAAHEWELHLGTDKVLPSLKALYEADHSAVLIFHEDLDYLLQQVYSASCAMIIMRLLNNLPAESV